MTCRRKGDQLTLFEAKTTYDYSYKDPKKPREKVWHTPFKHAEKIKEIKSAPYTAKCVETFRAWKCVLPFDAFWQPKEITRTHPHQPFDPNYKLAKLSDEEYEEYLKTTPKIYWEPPAVCLSDIKCPKVRKLIMDNIYTSDWKKKNAEVGNRCDSRKGLPTTCYENSARTSLRYEYDLIKSFPPGWVQKCEKWDSQYPGHVVNQTTLFWNTFKYDKAPPPVGESPHTAVDAETKHEIRELIKKDELRQPFDIMKNFYTGYCPTRDVGPLRKKDIYEDPYKQMLNKESKTKQIEACAACTCANGDNNDPDDHNKETTNETKKTVRFKEGS